MTAPTPSPFPSPTDVVFIGYSTPTLQGSPVALHSDAARAMVASDQIDVIWNATTESWDYVNRYGVLVGSVSAWVCVFRADTAAERDAWIREYATAWLG